MTDQYLENEWNTHKAMMGESAIPGKYRELICLAVHAATQEKYGIFYRTETAKMAGATDEEIREVASLVKQDIGWGPFMRLNQANFEEFKKECLRAFDRMKEHQTVKSSM